MEREIYQQFLHKVKHGQDTTDRHLLTFFSLAVGINAKNILELGVRDGNSTLPWIVAAKETGGAVTSVDLEPTSWQCPKDYNIYWSFVQSDAIKFLEEQVSANKQYDLIYVDDWHAYRHVKRELELIEHLVGPRSLVLIHDLMYMHADPHYRCELNTTDPQWAEGGPYRAVAELDTNVWEWSTIPVNHGMTILRKKSTHMVTG